MTTFQENQKASSTDKILILKKIIGNGATRECYQHPSFSDKCIKIVIKGKSDKILKRELKYYPIIKATLNNFIVKYDNKLVQTDKGIGLVCELVKDENNKLSPSLLSYLKTHSIDKELESELHYFTYQLIEHRLYFYDFNLKNFVVQQKNGKKHLKYIDLKSYENNKSWTFLKLEKIFPPLAELIMIRRLKRLYKTLGMNFFK